MGDSVEKYKSQIESKSAEMQLEINNTFELVQNKYEALISMLKEKKEEIGEAKEEKLQLFIDELSEKWNDLQDSWKEFTKKLEN